MMLWLIEYRDRDPLPYTVVESTGTVVAAFRHRSEAVRKLEKLYDDTLVHPEGTDRWLSG